MNKKTFILSLIFLLLSSYLKAGKIYCVVTNYTQDIECKDANHYVLHNHKDFIVTSEKWRKNYPIDIYLDRNTKLLSLEAVFKNSEGEIIKKIKKGDLQRTNYKSDMVSDIYTLSSSYCIPSCPLSVSVDYKIEVSNGFAYFETFSPVDDDNTKIIHAAYHLTTPPDINVIYKTINTAAEVKQSKDKDGNIVTSCEMNNLEPFDIEDYSLPISEILPTVFFAPRDFSFLGTHGCNTNWESFGLWQNGLLKDRDVLPDDFKNEIISLTANCKSQKEKIAVLYNKLGKTMRYNSIQLGIGGWQPETASDVIHDGMGDCKGLTNLMKAMLKVVGIPSYYTIINNDHRKILKDFACIGQSNHVILCIPQQNDSIWLECTAADWLPVGFLHNSIAGHDAIVINNNGGHHVTLPSYKINDNRDIQKGTLTLQPDGSALLKMNNVYYNKQYEDYLPITLNKEKEKQLKFIQDLYYLPEAEFDSLEFINNKSEFKDPYINELIKVKSCRYCNITGNRLFCHIDPTEKFATICNDKIKRTHDIYIPSSMKEDLYLDIIFPEGYTAEAIPKGFNLKNSIGMVNVSLDFESGKLHYHKHFERYGGIRPTSSYTDLINIQKAFQTLCSMKMVLTKK